VSVKEKAVNQNYISFGNKGLA